MEDCEMATLNIKNFPDTLAARIRERARRERRSMSQEVIHLLCQAVEEPEEESILGLRGLGKDRWTGIDAAKHVAEERDGWE